MYSKLLNLSIEELEVEIEDIDICIGKLNEEIEEFDRQVEDLTTIKWERSAKVGMLQNLKESISDLILEKQKEETH